MRRVLSVLVASVVLSGCYHATVDTTPAAGPVQQGSAAGQTIDKPWAHGFIFGLVPPAPVEAKDKCPAGVSKVETMVSLPNMLATFLTGSLYTPMSIKVTCR